MLISLFYFLNMLISTKMFVSKNNIAHVIQVGDKWSFNNYFWYKSLILLK